MKLSARLGIFASMLIGLGAAQTAQAQDNTASIALNQYEHSVPGDAFFGLPSPWVGGHLMPRFWATFDYAKDPLELVNGNDELLETIVSAQAFIHIGASLALWDRLQVSVDLPLGIIQDGADSAIGLNAPTGFGLGDLRLGLRGRLIGEYYDAFQLGVGGFIWVPTGDSGGFAGEGSVYGKPYLALGGRAPHFVWNATAGIKLRGSENPHDFQFGGGVAVTFLDDALQIGPEIYGGVALEDIDLATNNGGAVARKGSVNLEALLGAQLRLGPGILLGAAGGPGLANGVGTPEFRVLGRLGFAPLPDRDNGPVDTDGDGIFDDKDACVNTPGIASDDPAKHGCPEGPPPDRDGDGIIDVEDDCPDEPGVKSDIEGKNGCPLPNDKDNDGIVDDDDACPDVPGVKTDDPETNGCPEKDTDGDGILDKDDACVDVPGIKSDDPAKNGCPGDKDGDGIIDTEDKCPDQPGIARPDDPSKHGCPRVIITDKEIIILQKVEFDTGKWTIKPVSDPLLDDVAQTLKDHLEITLIEVQGHTDSRGSRAYNKMLSANRANSVKKAMMKRGIASKRMVTKGFGPDKPIDTNDTDVGRQNNRRVQFLILKHSKK